MGKISRVDRAIGAALLAVLLSLLGLAVSRQAGGPTSADGAATTPTTSATAVTPGTTPPTASAATAVTATAPPTTSTSPATTTTSTTTSTSTATTTPGTPPPMPVPGPVSAVGDSIMLDIQPYLQQEIPGINVDGEVSRQFESGIAVVQADKAAGTLGNVLVVELGTNGTVTSADFDALMAAAAGVQRVVFVNLDVPRPWEAPDNAVLAAGVAQYPGVAVLVDWNSVSSPHPEWFTPDQVHLQPAGAQALAALITQNA